MDTPVGRGGGKTLLERWGARHGEGEVVGTRNGSPIVRYSGAQPTSSTAGEIDAMALYAGMSVGHVHHRASARAI